MSDTPYVECQVLIDASQEAIFPFLIEQEQIVKWMGLEATLNASQNGKLWINVTGRDIASGSFLEVVPHHRVVYAWGWERGGSDIPPGSTKVEIDLIPQAGKTLVRLRHWLPRAQAEHEKGWIHYLERLAKVAEGKDHGRDPWTND